MSLFNREQFVKTIKQDMLRELLSNYFDENMALYNLIGNNTEFIMGITRNDNNINSNGIAFRIETDSKESANSIVDIINTHETSNYHKQYNALAHIENDCVIIELGDKVSD